MTERTAADPPEGTGAPVEEKRVSWAELFFDLVFVFAVTEVSQVLGAEHSGADLLRALVVFVPIYWLWVGTAIRTNLGDAGRPSLRLAIFTVALAAIFMALALPDAYGRSGMLYAVAYWAGRVVLGGPLLRRERHLFSLPLNPYTVSMLVTGPLLILGALVHGAARESVWASAAALDLAAPSILRRRLRGMHLDAGHLAERFGLFVLIAIGESVVTIGVSARSRDTLTPSAGCAVVAAFALSCGLWWVYFHFAADAVRFALATAEVQLDIARLVLSYGHLAFIAAIIVVAAGMREAVGAPARHLGWAAAALLFGGTALYLAAFGFTRWAMFRLVSTTRLTTAAAALLLLPAAAYLPAVVSLGMLAAVVAALNTVELMRVEHLGWRALLERRRTRAESTGH